jgi:nitroreductase
MEFKDVLKNRISCRSYNGKPVTQDQIDEILAGMRSAPTARHLELYKVKISIGDQNFIEKIGELTGQFDRINGCGAVLVFFAEPREVDQKYGGKEMNIFAAQDATLACAYAQLAATNLGLSTLWMGGYTRDEELKKLCGVDDTLISSSILIIGYTDSQLEKSSRKDLKEILI